MRALIPKSEPSRWLLLLPKRIDVKEMEGKVKCKRTEFTACSTRGKTKTS
jgi:hypothetical protein